MSKPLAIRIDDKGRIQLPQALRHTLHLEPGDVCFLEMDAGTLRVIRAHNPFDLLARQAIDEANHGEMIPLSQLTPTRDPDASPS